MSGSAKADALWSEDAERAVLAAMLISPDAAALAQMHLVAEHFYRGGHRALFTAMIELRAKALAIDPVSLANQLEAQSQLSAVGGKEYIATLLDEVPHADHVVTHAGIVREFHQRRGLVELGMALARAAADRSIPVTSTLDQAGQQLLARSTGHGEEGFRPVKSAVRKVLERLMAIEEGRATPGLQTGWPELDERLDGGFDLGSLVLLVGAPSSGKTSLMLQILTSLALEGAGSTAMVSAEMEEEMLAMSVLSQLSDVPRGHIKIGKMTPAERGRFVRATATVANSAFYIDDEPSPDIEDVERRCTLMKARHPDLCAIGVDFLQLIQRREKGNGDKISDTLERISYALKGLAKRLNVVVFATAQPNDKQIEDRDDKRPQLRDIANSAGPRRAADVVMLLYRAQMYSASASNELEVNFGKNRAGATSKAVLEWEGSYVRAFSPRRRQLELEAKRRQDKPLELTVGAQR